MVVGKGVLARTILTGREKKNSEKHQTKYTPLPTYTPVFMYTHTWPAKPALGGFEQSSQRLFPFLLS